jgi:hypothetical protein
MKERKNEKKGWKGNINKKEQEEETKKEKQKKNPQK